MSARPLAERLLRQVCALASTGGRGRTTLSEIRRALPGVPRARLDAALYKLEERGDLRLLTVQDVALTPAEWADAIPSQPPSGPRFFVTPVKGCRR